MSLITYHYIISRVLCDYLFFLRVDINYIPWTMVALLFNGLAIEHHSLIGELCWSCFSYIGFDATYTQKSRETWISFADNDGPTTTVQHQVREWEPADTWWTLQNNNQCEVSNLDVCNYKLFYIGSLPKTSLARLEIFYSCSFCLILTCLWKAFSISCLVDDHLRNSV